MRQIAGLVAVARTGLCALEAPWMSPTGNPHR